MSTKIWLSVCLVLLAHNLVSLISESYSVNYKLVEKDDKLYLDDETNYLLCTPFWRIKQLDSLKYESEIKNVSAKSFLRYSIASIENNLKVTKLFNLNESYILNNHVCFTAIKPELETTKKPFNKFLEKYQIFNILIYSKGKQPYLYETACHKEDQLPSVFFKAYKQKIFERNYLLNSDCSNPENQINYDRRKCLNKCLAQSKTKANFYESNDSGLFDLNLIVNGRESAHLNVNHESQGVREILKGCFKKCTETDCFREVFNAFKIDYHYYRDYLQKEGREKVSVEKTIYLAYYSMDDYYLQLFGLLTLFTGTFFVKLLPALLSLSVKKFRRHHSAYYKFFRIFRLFYPKIKFTITFLSFIIVLNLSLSMLSVFKFKLNHPIKTNSFNYVSDPSSFVTCVSIDNAFSRAELGNLHRRKSSILREYDFRSIEKRTKNLLTELLFSLEIYSGIEPIKNKVDISEEILFKIKTLKGRTHLSRCFLINFELQDIKYKTMMPLAYLNFSLNTKQKELFLIDKKREFTSGLVNFRGRFNQQKVTQKFSKKSKKSNCRDYSKEQGCDSRRNCIDTCVNIEFVKKHGSIPTNTVVNAENLPSFVLSGGIKFNETPDRSIEELCSNKFNQLGCAEIYFEEGSELVSPEDRNFILMKLTYLSLVQKEIKYKQAKTILDIVSLTSIFFGLNAASVLATLFFALSQTFRFKLHKAFSMVVFLMAGIGFLAHNYWVYQSIISGDPNENMFFEKSDQYIMPSPVFCVPPAKKIDDNHQFTGEYLDDLTKKLTFKDAFRMIIYYNRKNDTKLIFSKLNSTATSNFYSSPEVELTHFYYFNLKCFKISLKVNYREEDFYFRNNRNILEIILDEDFKVNHKEISFFYQQTDSNEINGGFTYKIGRGKDANIFYSYKIEFELFKITKEDKFELLKNPRNLFYEKIQINDPTEYLNEIKKQFKDDYNLTTSDLLLDEYFNLEVDNELFEQYFRQIRNISDEIKVKSQNFEQNIPNIVSDLSYSFNGISKLPDFSFSLSFLIKRVEITNNDNYTKLVISFLNSLSLWLNVCILDVGAYINSVLRLGLHLYCLLIWARDHMGRRRQIE